MFDSSTHSRAAPAAPSAASDTPAVAELCARWLGLGPAELMAAAIAAFAGRIALVSSFGAESAVLLRMAADIDPALPVIFLDTGKLFGETLRYRDELVRRLGLRDVRTVTPSVRRLAAEDPDGTLWRSDPDRCCALRKVEPLLGALAGFAAWINGRKRSHGALRAALPAIEAADGRVKFNPLHAWSHDEVAAYLAARRLPPHPLSGAGYASIGCRPCTAPIAPGEDRRAGRWRGRAKTECGIHLPPRG